MPRNGQSDADGQRARHERADHRHDLHEPRERADEDEVRQADRPERERQQCPDQHDKQRLAADERTQLQVDQVPGVAQLLALWPRQKRGHEVHGALALEDPVRRRREHEEDADHHLESLQRHLERGMDERARLRHLAQTLVDRREHLVLEARRVLRLVVDLRLRRPAERVLHLVDGARDGNPEQ